MAASKNTQGVEDSLKGGQPDAAEAQAAGAETPAAVTLPQPDPALSASGDGGQGGDAADAAPRRIATAADTILHDGVHFAPGDPVPLTKAAFDLLQPTGTLAETDWSDLDAEF